MAYIKATENVGDNNYYFSLIDKNEEEEDVNNYLKGIKDNESNYVISLIENNEVEKLNNYFKENKDKACFDIDFYKVAFASSNYCELIKILCDNDNREKEVIANDVFRILEKKIDVEENYIGNEDKANTLINKVKNGELEISFIDDVFIENLKTVSDLRNKIIKCIDEDNVDELKNCISNSKLLLSQINSEEFDLLIYTIENNASSPMIEYIISQYPSLNYYSYDKSPLCCAITTNNLDLVKLLLDHGADINKNEEFEDEPLIHAIKRGNNDIIKYLIDHGATIDQDIDKSIYTPLYYAIQMENEEIVQYLIDHGAAFNSKKEAPSLPSLLTEAIRCQNDNIAKRLIDAGADITSDVGINSLLATINLGKKDLVKYMLEKGVDVNKKTRGNKTSLMVAIDKGDEEIVKELVEHGADVNLPGKSVEKFDSEHVSLMSLLSPSPPKKPLTFAIEKGNEKIITTLIEHGADINVKNGGHSTLMLSIVNNKESVLKCLLEHGVDTTVKSKSWEDPPLIVAINQGKEGIIRALLDAKVEVNLQDDYTPLVTAIKIGNESLAKELIAQGADVNLKGKRCYSPLVTAIIYENESLVHYLIEKGANINEKDENGETPLSTARLIGNEAIIKYLTEQGAK